MGCASGKTSNPNKNLNNNNVNIFLIKGKSSPLLANNPQQTQSNQVSPNSNLPNQHSSEIVNTNQPNHPQINGMPQTNGTTMNQSQINGRHPPSFNHPNDLGYQSPKDSVIRPQN